MEEFWRGIEESKDKEVVLPVGENEEAESQRLRIFVENLNIML